jgi:hypothetical protein
MSMLDRYRKPGGFVQLLALIETCPLSKQEKLLDVISQEDRRWSETVRAKMLSIDRIYAWSDDTLAEIFGTLQDLTVAVALSVAAPELKLRITGFFSHGRIRKIDELLTSKGPTPAEVGTTHLKIIEAVRKMGSDGFLRFENIDPVLVINEDIDDYLAHPPVPGDVASLKKFTTAQPKSAAQQVAHSQVQSQSPTRPRVLHSYSHMSEHGTTQVEVNGVLSASSTTHTASHATDASESRVVELQNLKKRVADLSKENATLRHELSMAKSKLDQIKKIA